MSELDSDLLTHDWLCTLQTGQLHTYLAALPVMSSLWGCSLAYCTSLQELAVMDVLRQGSQSRIAIPTEPAFLALGPNHLAVGMNNKVVCCLDIKTAFVCGMLLAAYNLQSLIAQ